MFDRHVSAVFAQRYILLAEAMLDFAQTVMSHFQGDNLPEALARMDAEFPNIAAVLDAAGQHPSEELHAIVTDLYLCVGPYLDIRHLVDDNRRWGWMLVRQSTAPPIPPEFADLYTDEGLVPLPAIIHATTPLTDDDRQTLGDLGERVNKLGLLHWYAGLVDNALLCFQHALEIFRRTADTYSTVGILLNMSNVFYTVEQDDEVLRLVKQALSIAQAANDRELEAQILPHLAQSYIGGGQVKEAEETFRRAITLFEEFDEQAEVTDTKFNYALFCEDCGQHEQALQLARESLAIMEALGLEGASTVRGWLADQTDAG